jgi:hypothetical protein
VRIQSDIRIGTRTDKVQGFEDKVRAVRDLLAMDGDEGGANGDGRDGGGVNWMDVDGDEREHER